MVNNYWEISVESFEKEMKKDDFIVIDVRTPWELQETGVIWEDTLHIDVYSPWAAWSFSELSREKNYLLYCRSANRTKQVQSFMIELWFPYVKDLEGWIEKWIQSGRKTS